MKSGSGRSLFISGFQLRFAKRLYLKTPFQEIIHLKILYNSLWLHGLLIIFFAIQNREWRCRWGQVHACSKFMISMPVFDSFFFSSNTWLSRSYNMKEILLSEIHNSLCLYLISQALSAQVKIHHDNRNESDAPEKKNLPVAWWTLFLSSSAHAPAEFLLASHKTIDAHNTLDIWSACV